MGCKQSRESAENYANELPEAKKESSLLLPEDDYVPSICGLRGGDFAVAGGEGWLYIYNSEGQQTVKLKAHRKSLNRLMESKDLLFSGSSDGTVLSWKGLKEGCQEPVQKFEGHSLAVSGLDLLEAGLFTGSRDCTVMLWDVETGQAVQKNKILRNVVTSVRRASPSLAVQASEDLQLRLWDLRAGLKAPAMAAGGA